MTDLTQAESVRTFRKHHAEQAYALLGVRHHHDPVWIRALMRGWENLERRRWQWNGTQLVIQSTTDPARRYTVTAEGCQCHAAGLGNVCDHMTSWWLCHEAERVSKRKRAQRPAFDALVDELF